MPRDTSFDDYTYQVLVRGQAILQPLANLGQLNGTGAVYIHWMIPQEPFPFIYLYNAGVTPDYGQGASGRVDTMLVNIHIVGGPVTNYKTNPEDAVNKLVTAVINELDYRPFLQDPTTGAALRYLDPRGCRCGKAGRVQAFNYGELGNFTGCEIPLNVVLQYNVPRLS